MSRTLVAVPAINGGTNDLVLVATTLGTPVLPRDHVLVVSLAPPTGSGTRPSRSASLFTLVLLNPIAITGTATNSAAVQEGLLLLKRPAREKASELSRPVSNRLSTRRPSLTECIALGLSMLVPLTAVPAVNGPTNVSTSLPSSSLVVVALPLARARTAHRSPMPFPLVANWVDSHSLQLQIWLSSQWHRMYRCLNIPLERSIARLSSSSKSWYKLRIPYIVLG